MVLHPTTSRACLQWTQCHINKPMPDPLHPPPEQRKGGRQDNFGPVALQVGPGRSPALNPLAAAVLKMRKTNILVVDDNTICQRVVGKCPGAGSVGARPLPARRGPEFLHCSSLIDGPETAVACGLRKQRLAKLCLRHILLLDGTRTCDDHGHIAVHSCWNKLM